MSEPARAEPAKKPKPEVTKKSAAPLPKPGSPAKPALAKLRRALGELIAAHRAGAAHMVPVYAANLRSSLDAALQLRAKATDTERSEITDLEAPLNRLLSHYEQQDPSRIQKHDSAIEAHGDGLVNRDTPVHSGYDIEIELTPFKAAP